MGPSLGEGARVYHRHAQNPNRRDGGANVGQCRDLSMFSVSQLGAGWLFSAARLRYIAGGKVPAPMIQLYHVSKRFENGTDALVDVTLRVREGEFVFLTGASGAGKSTLLRLLLVMERVSEGQVLIGGRNVHVLRDGSVPYLRRNIGLVFQDFKLIERRTVFDNVAIAMEILGLARAEIDRRVTQLLADLGLEGKGRLMPAMLSGGERQRVALARALANEPAILLADEPTGNLDPTLSVEIMDLLLEINRRGTTVVVATHDYALVKRYGLRVVHLEGGRIAEDRPRTHPAADIGEGAATTMPKIARKTGPKVTLPAPSIAPIAPIIDEGPEQSAFDEAARAQAAIRSSSPPMPDSAQLGDDDALADDDHDEAARHQTPSTSIPTPAELALERRRNKFASTFTAANLRVSAARITGPVVPSADDEHDDERGADR